MEFEAKIITFLQSGANDGWTAFFKSVSLFGSYVGLILVFFTFFYLNKKYAFTYLLTYLLGVGFNYIVKAIVSRDRPFFTYDSIQSFTDTVGSSMPSGHAVSSVITAIFVSYFVYRLAKTKFVKIATLISMVLFVFAVCFSRMYLGVHYISDIAVGIIVGAIIGSIGVILFKRSSFKKRENT